MTIGTLFDQIVIGGMLRACEHPRVFYSSTAPKDTGHVQRVAGSATLVRRTSITSLKFLTGTELFAMEQIRKHCPASGFVLDIGCGEPDLLNLMANSMFFPQTVGVDINEKSLRMYGKVKHWMGVLADAAQPLDFLKPAQFNVAILMEVLEHLSPSDGVAVLENARTALQLGGVLVLTLPILPPDTELDMEEEQRKWGHVTYYSSEELQTILRKTGFTVKHLSYGIFIGRRVKAKKVRDAFAEKWPVTIFDRMADIWSSGIAAAFFSDCIGPAGGHMRIVARKNTK